MFCVSAVLFDKKRIEIDTLLVLGPELAQATMPRELNLSVLRTSSCCVEGDKPRVRQETLKKGEDALEKEHPILTVRLCQFLLDRRLC